MDFHKPRKFMSSLFSADFIQKMNSTTYVIPQATEFIPASAPTTPKSKALFYHKPVMKNILKLNALLAFAVFCGCRDIGTSVGSTGEIVGTVQIADTLYNMMSD